MLKFLAVFTVFLIGTHASLPTSAHAADNPNQASPPRTESQRTTPLFPVIGMDKVTPAEHSVTITKIPPVSIVRNWIDWGVWVFSGLLVIVGFLQVWILGRTLGAIKRQAVTMESQAEHMDTQTDILFKSVSIAETAQQNAINKERPRLSIEIKDFVFGEISVLNYELTCHGTTPAYVQSSWELTSLTAIPDFPWTKSQYGISLGDLPEVVSVGTIKGFVFIMGTDDCGFLTEDSQREALDNGGLYLHFRVRIVFKDIFDDMQEHEYLLSKVYGLKNAESDSSSVGNMLGLPSYPGWGDSVYKYGQNE